jgi:aminoglycoside phosphotransferase
MSSHESNSARSIWHQLDGVGQMVTVSADGDEAELTVGCAPGWNAEEPAYTYNLSREDAAALGRALLDWSQAK